MKDDLTHFESRKQDHIELALLPANQARELNVFDRFTLIHEALPDLDFDDIKLTGKRFGHEVQRPFLVSSMTAGHSKAHVINRNLMEACSQSAWAMGVGSQRRELSEPLAALEWASLRKDFSNVSLLSNLGIAQLLCTSLDDIKRLTNSIDASALIIHCNPLQEVIQPEGTPQFKGCWQVLEDYVLKLDLPIVVKETGCGFSLATLKRLNDIGVAVVDVSGSGGTHWGRIEGLRAKKNSIRQKTSITFKDWGIDTLTAVNNAVSINPDFEIWGSGGLRHGLDAAKLFSLGASTVGFGLLMLEAALRNAQSVYETMMTIEYELKVAMFCTGSSTINELRDKHVNK